MPVFLNARPAGVRRVPAGGPATLASGPLGVALGAAVGAVAAADWRVALVGAGAAVVLPFLTLTLGVSVVTFEMVVGGHGHFASLAGLSLRQHLTAALLAFWMTRKLAAGDFRVRGGVFGYLVAAVLAVTLVAALLSAGAGTAAGAALKESGTVVFALLFFVFADVVQQHGSARPLLVTFLWSLLALATAQILLTAVVSPGWLPEDRLAQFFQMKMGGVTRLSPRFVRVFIVGSFFFQVGILLFVSARMHRRALLSPAWDPIALLLLSAALLCTYTRGFWLATVLGCVLLAGVHRGIPRARLVTFGVFIGMPVLALVVLSGNPVVGMLVERLLKLFDPAADASVAVRTSLYPRLLARISEAPMFGYGFGQEIEGGLYYENSYLYFLIKFGFVGLLAILAMWGALVAWAWSIARRAEGPVDTRVVAGGLFAATCSVLAVTAINPFINSPMGYFYASLVGAVLWGLDDRSRNAASASSASPRS